MKMTLFASFLILGTTLFAASNIHKVAIAQDSVIEGKAVKAGQYKISVVNGNAVLKMGKESIEVPAREETETNKAASDELTYKDNTNLQAISIGGTTTKIVFEGPSAMRSGS